MSYNGWQNYETWCVNLWLENEEPSYRYWRATAQEVWDESEEDEPFTRSEVACLALGRRLKEELEEASPLAEGGGGLWEDLINAALSEVNWDEIANGWLEECEGYEYKNYQHA